MINTNKKQHHLFRQNWFDNYFYFVWLMLGLLIEIIVISFIIFDAIPLNGEDLSYVWFNSFHYLTQQTNLFVVIFVLIFVFLPNLKIFKKNTFLIIVVAYITATLIGYNCILLPSNISDGSINSWSAVDWTNTIFLHMINPIYTISLFIFLLISKKDIDVLLLDWWKILLIGSIYPTLYLSYAIFLPFVSDHSVYGSFTNLNINLEINGTPGSLFNLIYIVLFYVLIIGLVLIYYFIFKKVTYKKQNN